MFKAKLQELSQQKRWGLPRYIAMKDGPDHLPHFKASVYVNGLSFHSPTVSTSSKQALNEAAKLAFLHFSSSSGYLPPSFSSFFYQPFELVVCEIRNQLSLPSSLLTSFSLPGPKTGAEEKEADEAVWSSSSHSVGLAVTNCKDFHDKQHFVISSLQFVCH